LTRFVALPADGSEIFINPDQVRMLVQVSEGGNTQIVFDETHFTYTDMLPADVAALCARDESAKARAGEKE
jgi:hypothetical protein